MYRIYWREPSESEREIKTQPIDYFIVVVVQCFNSTALRCDKRQCNEFYLIKCRNMNLARGRMMNSNNNNNINNIKYEAIHCNIYKCMHAHCTNTRPQQTHRPIFYNKRAITIIYLTAAKTEITCPVYTHLPLKWLHKNGILASHTTMAAIIFAHIHAYVHVMDLFIFFESIR